MKTLSLPEPQALIVLFAVITGHLFSIFLKFQGGKGVATGFGVLLGYDFILGLTILGVWGLTVLTWRYSSGGAVTAFLSLPLLSALMNRSNNFLVFTLAVSGVILWKHQGNIYRLIRGTEDKIGTGHPSS